MIERTMTAPVSTASTIEGGATGPGRKARSEDERADSTASVSFDVTLDVARTALVSRVRHRGTNSESAHEVFESGGRTPAQRRGEAVKAAYAQEVRAKGEARFDTASVQARRSDALVETALGDRPESTEARQSSSERLSEGKAQVRAPVPVERTIKPASGKGRTVAAASGEQLDAPGKTDAKPVLHPVGRDRVMSAVGPGAVRPAVGAKPPAGSEQLAARVGEVLGAQRSGGAESARAPQAGTAPPQGGSDRSSFKPQARAQQSREGRSGGSTVATSKSDSGKFDELIQSLRVRQGAQRSTARMHLNPPELGRLLIDVRLEREQLQLDIRTETPEATQLMQGRLRALQAALAEHGFTIERFDVAHEGQAPVSDSSGGEPSFAQSGQRASSNARPTGEAEERTEEVARDEVESPTEPVIARRRLDMRI